MNLIGTRMRKQRMRLQKTASLIAVEIGVPISTYREWENGRSIRGEFYIRIARTLQISLYELLTGEKLAEAELMKNLEQIEQLIEKIKLQLRLSK